MPCLPVAFMKLVTATREQPKVFAIKAGVAPISIPSQRLTRVVHVVVVAFCGDF